MFMNAKTSRIFTQMEEQTTDTINTDLAPTSHSTATITNINFHIPNFEKVISKSFKTQIDLLIIHQILIFEKVISKIFKTQNTWKVLHHEKGQLEAQVISYWESSTSTNLFFIKYVEYQIPQCVWSFQKSSPGTTGAVRRALFILFCS